MRRLHHICLGILLLCAFATQVIGGEIEDKVDSLFMLASTPEAKYQNLVDPAREELGKMGEVAVQRLIDKIGTTDARERQALSNIFSRIGSVAVPYLVDVLTAENKDSLENSARSLGEIGDKQATPALIRLFSNPAHSVRATAATSVGQCKDSSAVRNLISLLADPKYPVRKSAAVAIGKIGHEDAAPWLIKSLGDPHFSVRMTAMEALVQIGQGAGDALLGTFDGLDVTAQNLALEVFSRLEFKNSKKLVLSLMRSANPYTRGFALKALSRISLKDADKAVRGQLKDESHPFVLMIIESLRANSAASD